MSIRLVEDCSIVLRVGKSDLVNMIAGFEPHSYEFMTEFSERGWGYLLSFVGGFRDEFIWNRSELEKLSIEDLARVYKDAKYADHRNGVAHSYWAGYDGNWTCQNCGSTGPNHPRVCPLCEAIMDGDSHG